jgi:hypothetical protein
MISVVCCSVSTTVTTTTGQAFFITAPAVAASSLLLNERLICPSPLEGTVPRWGVPESLAYLRHPELVSSRSVVRALQPPQMFGERVEDHSH